MQYKEKKWGEVEQVLAERCKDDKNLNEKLSQLKYNLEGDKKISNVVKENERMRAEIE